MKCRGGAISVAHVGMKTNMRKIKSDTQTGAGEAAQTDSATDGASLRWPQSKIYSKIYFEFAETKNSINTELFRTQSSEPPASTLS